MTRPKLMFRGVPSDRRQIISLKSGKTQRHGCVELHTVAPASYLHAATKLKSCAADVMDIPQDCLYEILRRAGPIAAAACVVVCKSWKRVIFKTRLPILVVIKTGLRWGGFSHVTRFTAFVRARRGYTACTIMRLPDVSGELPALYDISRGASRRIEVISKGYLLNDQLRGIYGDYKVFAEELREFKAMWPDYAELAAILGAIEEFSSQK